MFIKHCSRSIFLRVMIGLMIGIIYGVGTPDLAVQVKPLGSDFIRLIRILIALIVFYVVVNGISSASDLKKVGRIGLRSVTYFEIFTTVALVLGLVVAYSLDPGNDANIHLNELPVGDVTLYARRTQEIHGPVAFLMGLIPTFTSSAFVENDILQVLLFSALFGNALNLVGEQASDVARLINEFGHIVFRIMGMIVRLTPLSVFGVMAFTTVRHGVDSLSHLGALTLVLYVTCLAFVMTMLGSTLRPPEVRILPFLCCFCEELMIVTGTVSPDAVLPQAIRELEHMGIRNPTVGPVVPISYSFNLDGFSIYPVLAVVLIAHVTSTPLAMTSLVAILLAPLATFKGAHDIPSSIPVTLIATLTAVPATPMASLVLVLPMD